MDRIVGLEVFVAIVDNGSFSRAAGRLGLSPTMISTHLANLEARLGAKLIERTTRKFSLTPQGHQFLEDARAILNALRQAETAVGQACVGPSGRVQIDAPGAIGLRYVTPCLPMFRARYPGIMLDISVGDRGTVFRTEGFDIVIRIGEARESAGRIIPLGHTRFVQVASPDYLRRHGAPSSLDDLERHDAVVYASVDQPAGMRWRFWRDGQTQWLRPRAVASFNHGDAIAAAAVAGVGIAQTLQMLVTPEIATGLLVPILTTWNQTETPVQLIIPEDRVNRPAVAAAALFLRSQVNWG